MGLGIDVQTTPQNRLLDEARRELDGLFEGTLRARRRAETLAGSSWLSHKQRDQLEKFRARLDQRLAMIATAVDQCFGDLRVNHVEADVRSQAAVIRECAQAVGRVRRFDISFPEAIEVSVVHREMLRAWGSLAGATGEDPTSQVWPVGGSWVGKTDAGYIVVDISGVAGTRAHLLPAQTYERWISPGITARLGVPLSGEKSARTGSGTYVEFERGILHTGPAGTFVIGRELFDAWQSLPDAWLATRTRWPTGDQEESGEHHQHLRMGPNGGALIREFSVFNPAPGQPAFPQAAWKIWVTDFSDTIGAVAWGGPTWQTAPTRQKTWEEMSETERLEAAARALRGYPGPRIGPLW
jgi:hypothetical protein